MVDIFIYLCIYPSQSNYSSTWDPANPECFEVWWRTILMPRCKCIWICRNHCISIC